MHLVERLNALGANVRVVDNLSSGAIDNLRVPMAEDAIEFVEADLLDRDVAARMVDGIQVVFHNAADHGGCAATSTCTR